VTLQLGSILERKKCGLNEGVGRTGNGLQKIPFKFSQDFEFKIKGFKYFQTEFELG
jgi:hypothetical protein